MTTALKRRSAYGLDAGPDELSWRNHGICRDDPELWVSLGRGRAGEVNARRAVHACVEHCPVLAPCLRDARSHLHRVAGTVQGGRQWATVGPAAPSYEAKDQPRPMPCGPHCAHLRGLS